MTLANNYAPINIAADGVTTSFSGSWQMGSAAYAVVNLQNTTTGVLTLVNQGVGASDCQVTLNSSGFIVAFNTAPASGNNVIIQRSTTRDQTDPYSTARGFQGGVEEDSFDKLTAIAQENTDALKRSISVPFSDTATTLVLPLPALRANKALIFDASGNVIVSTDNYNDQVAIVTAEAAAAAASAASASSSASTATTAATTASAAATSASASATSATASATSATASATSAAASAVAAAAIGSGTSTTSNTIGTGSLTWTIQAGRNFNVGQFVVVASTASDANYVHGQVTSYNPITGVLVVNGLDTGGSGTFSAWTVSTSGPAGATGAGSGTVNSGTSGRMAYYASTGTAVSGNQNATISSGAMTLGSSGVAGSLALSGGTSGTTVLQVAAVATGTITMPSTTDQIVCRATTDTLTNKTFDTAGAGNSFKINGQAISSVSGNTSKVATVTGAVTNTHLAVWDASGNIKDGGAVPGGGLAITAGTPLTVNPYDSSTHNGGHGLGIIPTLMDIRLVCLTAELGYSIGDSVPVSGGANLNGSANAAYTVSCDATNLYYSGAGQTSITNKGSAGSSLITAANWKMVITPYKIA